jgi:hypothetical protein
MLFQFFRKKAEIDPVIEEQLEQTNVGREQDEEAIRERLEREYPTAVSAIEDYRKGYITEEHLKLRFSSDDIQMIHEESKRRNTDDKEPPASGYL